MTKAVLTDEIYFLKTKREAKRNNTFQVELNILKRAFRVMKKHLELAIHKLITEMDKLEDKTRELNELTK